MTTTVVYADLFEDEVAEVLRDIPGTGAVVMDAHREFYPARMMCEDGTYSPGNNMFTEYLDGRRSGQVNTRYMIAALTHKTFRVIIRA